MTRPKAELAARSFWILTVNLPQYLVQSLPDLKWQLAQAEQYHAMAKTGDKALEAENEELKRPLQRAEQCHAMAKTGDEALEAGE